MYLSVGASNGFGVFDNQERLKKISPYLNDLYVVQCSNFIQAFKLAVDYYNECQQETNDAVGSSFYGTSDDIGLNHFLFKREIYQQNQNDYI